LLLLNQLHALNFIVIVNLFSLSNFAFCYFFFLIYKIFIVIIVDNFCVFYFFEDNFEFLQRFYLMQRYYLRRLYLIIFKNRVTCVYAIKLFQKI